eukprot:SAG31_NODE_39398_length_288_cov_1.100529_1_plen_91_part_01
MSPKRFKCNRNRWICSHSPVQEQAVRRAFVHWLVLCFMQPRFCNFLLPVSSVRSVSEQPNLSFIARIGGALLVKYLAVLQRRSKMSRAYSS